MNCNSCGATLKDADPVCASCGAETPEPSQSKSHASAVAPILPEYYQSQFQKIRDSQEQYKGKWNWAACLLGPIWAFKKGLREIVVVYVLAIPFTFGISVVGYAIVFGLRGNYFYYSKLMKGKVLIV